MKMTLKAKYFESIQDMKALKTFQRKTLKRIPGLLQKVRRNNCTSVFKVGRSMF